MLLDKMVWFSSILTEHCLIFSWYICPKKEAVYYIYHLYLLIVKKKPTTSEEWSDLLIKEKNGYRIYEIEIASSPYSMPSFQDFGVELSLLYSFIPIKSFIKYYTLYIIYFF